MGAKLSRISETLGRRRSRSSGGQCAPHETGHDPAVHGAKLEDRNYNNESFKKRTVDPSDPQQNSAALAIQTQFRQHSAKEEVDHMKEEVAATRIQAGFRGYLDREEVRKIKDGKEEDEEEEEEVDIDLNDPDVEKAAIKIQAGFKGFKARKETQAQETTEDTAPPTEAQPEVPEEEEVDIDLNDPDVGKAALKIQAGFRGHQARKDFVQQKSELPTNTNQTESQHGHQEYRPDLDLAAMKIQAGFRGIKARDEIQRKKADLEAQEALTQDAEEEIDIDLNDPEVEMAALKIQAGFKGLKARKNQTRQRNSEEREVPTEQEPEVQGEAAPSTEQAAAEEEEAVDIDLDDPATEKAALKIQAGFRGYQTRKDLNDGKDSGEDQAAEPTEPEKPEGETAEEVAVEEPAAEKEQGQEETQAETTEGQATAAEEEEVDIDLNDPEVEKAATKIQAGFKGFKARKEMEGRAETDVPASGGGGGDDQVDAVPEQAAAEDEGQKNEGEGQEETTGEPEQEAGEPGEPAETAEAESEEKPAVDEGGQEQTEGQGQEEAPAGEQTEAAGEEEEVVDIDLNDPEVEKAAVKIQAGFKGMRARKAVRDTDVADDDKVQDEEKKDEEEKDEENEDKNIAEVEVEAPQDGEVTSQEPDEM